MPAPWASWRKILSCRQDLDSAVHDPKGLKIVGPHAKLHPPSLDRSKKRRAMAAPAPSAGCSKSCNNIRNVIHGNTRVVHRGDGESPPPSIMSQSISNPCNPKALVIKKEPILLTLSPLPTDPTPHPSAKASSHAKKLSGCYDCSSIALCHPPLPSSTLQPLPRNSVSPAIAVQALCTKCGDPFNKPELLEEHTATFHAVVELREGDSARSIVEIIFQTSWLRKDVPFARSERIFKVLNSPRTVAKFEEYRDTVKAKASKHSSRKHSRCLVDGNELLRFCSTSVSCSLARPWSSSASLCTSTTCATCQVLRNGFPTKKGQPGIYTTGTSGKAHDSILFSDTDGGDREHGNVRAMLVCRVIAGRVKKMSLESSQEGPGGLIGYDSYAGEAGQYSNIEELVVFNPKAVLPCFVVVYSF